MINLVFSYEDFVDFMFDTISEIVCNMFFLVNNQYFEIMTIFVIHNSMISRDGLS